jgi:hypothetical protein
MLRLAALRAERARHQPLAMTLRRATLAAHEGGSPLMREGFKSSNASLIQRSGGDRIKIRQAMCSAQSQIVRRSA